MLKNSKLSSKLLKISSYLHSTQRVQRASKFYQCTSGPDSQQATFEVGKEICGFLVNEVADVPELSLKAIRLTHAQTGAQYAHIARNDPNNVFCVGFRTTPRDSTGVPHILEHLVLCGSGRFPCRDPFFKMLDRSLASFMNAMTGPDYTIYPFATQNAKDFRNLMAIYLDAVFEPRLTQLDFLQEGWRLEHDNPDDISSPIVLKGVVFNEMKGVFADPQQVLAQRLQNALLPSHTYGVVSGGDPQHIPDLSWEALRRFHATHYHPSNSRIFSYGDLPLEDHLSFIDREYLSRYERANASTSVPAEPSWSAPRSGHIACRLDPLVPADAQTSVAVAFALAPIHDLFETFVLAVLGELLVVGPNSPFHRALVESGLGVNLLPCAGFDPHTRTTTFTVGLQGVSRERAREVPVVVERTLEEVSERGFEKERVEAVLHGVELGVKHETGAFGLGLAMSMAPLWNHGGDVVGAFRINAKVERLRDALRLDPAFLKQKVKHYFRENKHKYTLTMSPDEELEARETEAERRILEEKTGRLSTAQKESIWLTGQELKRKQDEKEDVSCLPTLRVSDISRSAAPVTVEEVSLRNGVPLMVSAQPTNGVTYFDMVLTCAELTADDDLDWLPLFCHVLPNMGAGALDFRALSQQAELCSGGLQAELLVTPSPTRQDRFEVSVHMRSHCLHRNVDRMLALWQRVLTEPRFDDDARFATLTAMLTADCGNGLVAHGHRYAMIRAAAATGFVAALRERTGGLAFLRRLQRLNAAGEGNDLQQTLVRMRRLADRLLGKTAMRFAIHTTPDRVESDVAAVDAFVCDVRGPPRQDGLLLESVAKDFNPCDRRTHVVLPLPINFVAKAFNGVPFTHSDCGPLCVAERLMFRFLHRQIREKGGAYGGGAAFSPGGAFCFYSYRDPHSIRTLNCFDDAVEWVTARRFSDADVAEAKLGAFQRIDAPVAPGQRAIRRFINRVTDEAFGEHRRSVLDATPEDVMRACQMYLVGGHGTEGACLIGPEEEALTEERGWSKECYD